MQNLNFLIPIAIIVLLIFAINAYAYAGLKVLIETLPSQTLRRIIKYLLYILPLGSLALTLYGFTNLRTNNSLGFWGAFGFNSLITLFVSMLALILVIFAGDIWRFIQGSFSWIQNHAPSQPEHRFMPERRKFIAQVALLVAAIPFSSFVYGIVRGKYNYKVHKHILSFEDLPEAFHGFTITQISDIHAGSLDNEEAVMHGIDIINEQKSDLFLFTGDLVNNDAEEFEPWKEFFAKIDAPFGKYSVLGNHDYGDYKEWPSAEAKIQNHWNIINSHAQAGFKILRDEHVHIEKNGQQISLLGVQNWGHGFVKAGDLQKTMKGLNPNAFKVLMSHDPTHFEHEVKNHPDKIHLTLSGHTHGMQMGVEFPWLKWSPIKYRYPKWAGMYEENGRYLNVNRGFGFLGFGGRVGIWPEITVIELRRITSDELRVTS